MTTQTLLVAQAVQHYRQGDYKQALKHYQQAAAKYGQHLFKANVQLCEQKLNGKALQPAATSLPQANTSNSHALAQQLEQTQQLLEHYYTRTQELEYQLKDR